MRHRPTPRLAAVRWTALGALLVAAAARAGDAPPFAARHGLDLARNAARAWAADAELIYVENDEDVDAAGAAVRWGYLFRSASRDAARGYSVRDGKVKEAADLGFDFPAPPLAAEWIDSAAALAAAEIAAGAAYRRDHAGRLSTMLLVRGAFDEKHPDASTWTVVYTSSDRPSLFVLVDAATGKVVGRLEG